MWLQLFCKSGCIWCLFLSLFLYLDQVLELFLPSSIYMHNLQDSQTDRELDRDWQKPWFVCVVYFLSNYIPWCWSLGNSQWCIVFAAWVSRFQCSCHQDHTPKCCREEIWCWWQNTGPCLCNTDMCSSSIISPALKYICFD